MKRDFKALLTATALALSLAVAPSVSVMAAEQTGTSTTLTGYATPENPTSVLDETGTPQTDFGSESVDVNASILGSSQKIIYSISIGYGDMKFTYDFGQTWNPETHTYDNNTSGTNDTEGGWVTAQLDARNNAISIENNSNYPISVSLSYQNERNGQGTRFNSVATNAGSVIGIFSDSNDTLRSNVNKAAYKGYLAANTSSLMTASFDLDMDYANLDFGTYDDYGVLDTSNTNSTVWNKTIYFTLCGMPDSSATLSTTEYTKVGTITITITPANSNKVIDRPEP
jgi:hypothetical protein